MGGFFGCETMHPALEPKTARTAAFRLLLATLRSSALKRPKGRGPRRKFMGSTHGLRAVHMVHEPKTGRTAASRLLPRTPRCRALKRPKGRGPKRRIAIPTAVGVLVIIVGYDHADIKVGFVPRNRPGSRMILRAGPNAIGRDRRGPAQRFERHQLLGGTLGDREFHVFPNRRAAPIGQIPIDQDRLLGGRVVFQKKRPESPPVFSP